MDFGIGSKIALVGGASQGIGRAAAAALASAGVRVAICARREEILAQAAKELAKETGGEVIPIVADLSKQDDRERALAETRSRLGEIDILVTNTGGPKPGRFANLTDSDWDDAYHLLLKSSISLIRSVLPHMKDRKWGRIIGVTSVSVREPIPNLVLSNVMRSGVTSLFKGLSLEVARDGITLNTVLPGLTDTERLRGLYGAQGDTEAALAKVGAGLPLGRLTRAQELGDVVAFLASEQASAITGSAIAIDGGQLKATY